MPQERLWWPNQMTRMTCTTGSFADNWPYCILFSDILNKVSVIYGFNFGILLDGPCREVWCHVPLSVTLTNFMSNRPEKLDHKVKYLNLTISTVKDIHILLRDSFYTVLQNWRDVSGMIELLLFAFLGSYLLNIQSITYFTKIFLLPTSCKNPDLNFFKDSSKLLPN